MPIYQTMFSDLKHHPRFSITMKHANLPQHVKQDWYGKQNYQREKLIVHKL
jgi:hypothetical protein